jgi:hypothetical protein
LTTHRHRFREIHHKSRYWHGGPSARKHRRFVRA